MNEAGVFIIGAGGHGRVVAGILRDMNVSIAGVFDDRIPPGTAWGNSRIVGGLSEVSRLTGLPAIVALGDNYMRRLVSASISFPVPLLAHSRSYIAPTAVVGDGSVICAGVMIIEGVTIGKHCIVNTSASIDHDCHLADFVHVACGATLAGGVVVEEGAFIGAGATVLPGIKIGAWSVVGGGATVIKNVAAGKTVVGTPAVSINGSEPAI
jgi:acetyltransferase EpsM